MGLDISHGTWRGAYSAFNRWRTEISKHLGIPLSLMEGFYPSSEDDSYMHPFSMVKLAINGNEMAKSQFDRETAMFPLLWDAFKPSPLHELLNHSDCDGEIAWEKCDAIANALEEILPELPNEDMGGHIGFIRDKTKTFISGLRKAYNKKENLEFR